MSARTSSESAVKPTRRLSSFFQSEAAPPVGFTGRVSDEMIHIAVDNHKTGARVWYNARMAAVLEARNLVMRYPGASANAVDGLTLAVREGACFGLLGPNGAGKTTTVEIM